MLNKYKAGLIISLLLALVVITACSSGPGPKYNEFAKCVSATDAVMYGAFWCPHCERVKKSFGDGFEFINYVECDPRDELGQPELCIEKKIEKYATFVFADGSRLIGEPKLSEIAEKTGCELPPDEE